MKNKELLDRLTARKKIYMIAGKFRGQLCLRFAVCSRLTRSEDVLFAWKEIESQAEGLLSVAESLKEAEINDD